MAEKIKTDNFGFVIEIPRNLIMDDDKSSPKKKRRKKK